MKFEVYKDRSGEFRWRLVSANGLIIADSGESYSTKGGAKLAAENVRDHAGSATIESIDEP